MRPATSAPSAADTRSEANGAWPGRSGSEGAEGLEETEQQKDNLCAPFVAARLIRRAGVTEYRGAPVDQDCLAEHAGTCLPADEGSWVPSGAMARRDYARPLPRCPAEEAGTDPGALARAIEEVSRGALEVVPVTGAFDATRVERLVAGAHDMGAWLIANLRTGLLWGSRPDPGTVLAELAGVPQEGPPPDWDAGHFVELELLVRGPAGSLVVVHDSYPTLGWRGRHLQPPRVVARALGRDDGRTGGVLVIGAPGSAERARRLAHEIGLEDRIWDNGSRALLRARDPRHVRSAT